VELGVSSGVVSRPSPEGAVHYATGFAIGGHARVDVLDWLAARLSARFETEPVSFDPGALGLPPGTTLTQPTPHRVYLAATAEPTWSPLPRLGLFAGLGIGMGRTTAPELQATGAEHLTLPTRAAVFVEVPVSLGTRYEVLPDWLVATISGSVGLLTDQSGALVSPYETPGKSGKLVRVGAFPELGTSWALLAGLGVLL
jgi:hypothetical protein